MTIRVAINHQTHYEFDREVSLSPHTIRLRPAPHSRTPIHSYSLKIQPETHFINWQQDAFGNFLARVVFPEKCTRLWVDVEVIADMTVINPFDFFLEEYAEEYPFVYDAQLQKELTQYLEKLECGELFNALVETLPTHKQRTIDFLVAVNQIIQGSVEYAIRLEPGVQTPEVTLTLAVGSCRDSAWLLVQALRHKGLAARFASGYLVQLKSDVAALDGPSGPPEDFTDLHAWCEVYIPGAGWVGLDPTSGLFASEGHIPLACTPDPVSAAPINGATDKCEVEFSYSNVVTRVHEDPRVTKPYTEEQWEAVLALGDKVDEQLVAQDVRLTMGGEPTFVSVDDMESGQWNTEALGEDKLKLAKSLLLRLKERFAPQGMLHYGQGKWYPGEEIPRWALGLFWRKDGEPLWRDGEYLARVDKNYGHGLREAHLFMLQLTSRLGLNADFCHSAYEDSLHYLLQEQNLPVNVESQIASAKDDLARRRLARTLERGLDKATGYILPLGWNFATGAWSSSHWETRRERVVLIPGDSPMGLRLPLNSLPLTEETLREEDIPRDHFAERSPLPKRADIPSRYAPAGALTSAPEANPAPREKKIIREYWHVLRTAVCVEPRDGRVHIFMPPLQYLEHYVQLIVCIEETAKALKIPVVIEGYEPPKDARVVKLLVTPDPGVIEVNIHPANNWRELVATTTTLYEEAFKSRLGAEKFMLDGRHTGTGGGNHVTMGGNTPADSPLLRRPDLLRSFITFWQHHPSLSYLFSGMFIGPTSQAPRVDEGRDEMLYELEVAFAQMPTGDVPQPWLVDRLLRNLLIDITGNTHRAEFCIDKLYAPGSATGRLGILEFRGFEMPPHERMALVQTLLLRCLLARFWRQPYQLPLVRWGTLLHDRFMLPHFIWADMKEVVRDLNEQGYEFDLNWLLPFEEFRFPHYGRVQIDDISLEVRWAIEPWHVLGEEVGSFGTARYVDSSVERVQIKAYGLTDGRYILACNGRRVPLHNTGTHGEYVAGVRYRAWQPPSALHPTIGIHAPLVFDLIDTWNGRSIGGCTYHVTHPGGRSYDAFPVNAFEAESRRGNRFWDMGHTQGPWRPDAPHGPLETGASSAPADTGGNTQAPYTPRPWVDASRGFVPHQDNRPMTPPAVEILEEYPHTLDLRRY